MNGKFEEKLAQLAFGDMSSEEAARIEAQVQKNPEAARHLAEYREMRGGLRAMADIPDHQLSNERLREAILARGLNSQPVEDRPARRGFGAGWVWMPVAACALGFFLISTRHKAVPAGGPVIELGNTVAATSMGDGRFAFNDKPSDVFASKRGTASEIKPTAPSASSAQTSAIATPVVSMEPSSRRHMARNRVRHSETERNGDPLFTSDSTLVAPNWGSSPITTPVEPPKAPKPIEKPKHDDSQVAENSGPIVLINSDTDADTGAPTATEVGTASNVVIGG